MSKTRLCKKRLLFPQAINVNCNLALRWLYITLKTTLNPDLTFKPLARSSSSSFYKNTLSLSHTLTPLHTYKCIHSHTHTLTRSLTLYHAHTHTLTHTHTHTDTYTHSFEVDESSFLILLLVLISEEKYKSREKLPSGMQLSFC